MASPLGGLTSEQESGFTEAGRRKGYYKRDGGAEDAIVLRRELRP